MSKLTCGVTGAMLLVWIGIIAAIGIGWVENVIKIVHSDFGHLTGVLVLRVVGIFVVPLGSVMGLFVS